MLKEKANQLRTDEEGSGLVLSLMVLIVLSVLGASLGVVTVGSYRLGDVNRDSNSAYYIAEAGANMAYEAIENQVVDVYNDSDSKTSFFDQMSKPFDSKKNITYKNEFASQFGDQPSAQVELIEKLPVENTKEYIIRSTGEVAGKKRIVEKSVKINWLGKGGKTGDVFNIPPNASVVAKDRIHYMGGKITDDVYLYSSEAASFETSNSVWSWPNKIYSSYPNFNTKNKIFYGTGGGIQRIFDSLNEKTSLIPVQEKNDNLYHSYFNNIKNSESFSTHNEDLNLSNQKTVTLESNLKIPNLIFGGNNTIDVKDNHITLVVDNIKTSNWTVLEMKGTGSLTIIVKNKADFDGVYNYTYNGNYIPGNLRIIFPHINDSIELIGGGFRIRAQIIAPFSHIKITRNPLIYGTVFADEVTITNNGGEVEHFEMNFDNSYFNDTSTGSENTGNLITSDPAVEK